MTDHILIPSKKAKAPLLATKTKPYKIKVNRHYSEEWGLMDEAWLVSSVYLHNYSSVSTGLRERYPDVTPDEIDRFIGTVKNNHPLETVDFNWDDIPVYATSNSCMEMSLRWLYKHPIKLTLQQERQLLKIVQDDKSNKEQRMKEWFQRYREKYGIEARLKRDREYQDEELVDMFCLLHGFNIGRIEKKKKEHESREADELQCAAVFWGSLVFLAMCIIVKAPWWGIALCVLGVLIGLFNCGHPKKLWDGLKAFGLFIGLIVATIGLFALAYWLMNVGWDSGNWALLFLCSVPILLLLALFAKIFNK